MLTKPKFSESDARAANADWGMNCGPAALAAIMNMTLEEVGPHIIGFDEKRYTNPTMMNEALRSIGRPWRKIGANWPDYGLVRIQWEGPWTQPGVPMVARYRHTHWIGFNRQKNFGNSAVFDINAISNGTGWCSLRDWSDQLVPWIIENVVPKANGAWHVTHALEVATAHD